MTRDEHIAAAEKWLAEAEHAARTKPGTDRAYLAITAAAGIAAAHFLGAAVSPVTVTMAMQGPPRNAQPQPSRPAGQGHDGQETAR